MDKIKNAACNVQFAHLTGKDTKSYKNCLVVLISFLFAVVFPL